MQTTDGTDTTERAERFANEEPALRPPPRRKVRWWRRSISGYVWNRLITRQFSLVHVILIVAVAYATYRVIVWSAGQN